MPKKAQKVLFLVNNPSIPKLISYHEIHLLKKMFKKFDYLFSSLKINFEKSYNDLL